MKMKERVSRMHQRITEAVCSQPMTRMEIFAETIHPGAPDDAFDWGTFKRIFSLLRAQGQIVCVGKDEKNIPLFSKKCAQL